MYGGAFSTDSRGGRTGFLLGNRIEFTNSIQRTMLKYSFTAISWAFAFHSLNFHSQKCTF
jgi:hypothetical protein